MPKGGQGGVHLADKLAEALQKLLAVRRVGHQLPGDVRYTPHLEGSGGGHSGVRRGAPRGSGKYGNMAAKRFPETL
jgi:hypothetical protein